MKTNFSSIFHWECFFIPIREESFFYFVFEVRVESTTHKKTIHKKVKELLFRIHTTTLLASYYGLRPHTRELLSSFLIIIIFFRVRKHWKLEWPVHSLFCEIVSDSIRFFFFIVSLLSLVCSHKSTQQQHTRWMIKKYLRNIKEEF